MKKKQTYGDKLRSGNMMYGPGCCAHNYTMTPFAIAHKKKLIAEKRNTSNKTFNYEETITCPT